MQKLRPWLVIAWFLGLYLWNLRSAWYATAPELRTVQYLSLDALGMLTSPVEILLSLFVAGGILSFKSK
jgi:hypothetical protein